MRWYPEILATQVHVEEGDEKIKIIFNKANVEDIVKILETGVNPLGDMNQILENTSSGKPTFKTQFTLKSPLRMRSAYAYFQRFFLNSTLCHYTPQFDYKPYCTYEPFYTTISENGISTVDYIW
jgi:hypothetical protein